MNRIKQQILFSSTWSTESAGSIAEIAASRCCSRFGSHTDPQKLRSPFVQASSLLDPPGERSVSESAVIYAQKGKVHLPAAQERNKAKIGNTQCMWGIWKRRRKPQLVVGRGPSGTLSGLLLQLMDDMQWCWIPLPQADSSGPACIPMQKLGSWWSCWVWGLLWSVAQPLQRLLEHKERYVTSRSFDNAVITFVWSLQKRFP